METTSPKYYYHDGTGMARPYVVTSLKVDEAVWKRAKKRAIDDEITLQELLNAAVAEYLKRKTLTEYRRKKREN